MLGSLSYIEKLYHLLVQNNGHVLYRNNITNCHYQQDIIFMARIYTERNFGDKAEILQSMEADAALILQKI